VAYGCEETNEAEKGDILLIMKNAPYYIVPEILPQLKKTQHFQPPATISHLQQHHPFAVYKLSIVTK